MYYFWDYDLDCRRRFGSSWCSFKSGSIRFVSHERKASSNPFGYIHFRQHWAALYLHDSCTVCFFPFDHLVVLLFGQVLKNIKNVIVVNLRLGKIKNVLNPVIDHDKVFKSVHRLGKAACRLWDSELTVCLFECSVGTYSCKAWCQSWHLFGTWFLWFGVGDGTCFGLLRFLVGWMHGKSGFFEKL